MNNETVAMVLDAVISSVFNDFYRANNKKSRKEFESAKEGLKLLLSAFVLTLQPEYQQIAEEAIGDAVSHFQAEKRKQQGWTL